MWIHLSVKGPFHDRVRVADSTWPLFQLSVTNPGLATPVPSLGLCAWSWQSHRPTQELRSCLDPENQQSGTENLVVPKKMNRMLHLQPHGMIAALFPLRRTRLFVAVEMDLAKCEGWNAKKGMEKKYELAYPSSFSYSPWDCSPHYPPNHHHHPDPVSWPHLSSEVLKSQPVPPAPHLPRSLGAAKAAVDWDTQFFEVVIQVLLCCPSASVFCLVLPPESI